MMQISTNIRSFLKTTLLLLALYLLSAPLLPLLEYKLYHFVKESPISQNKVQKTEKNYPILSATKVSTENRLKIVKINVDVRIVEGEAEEALSKGAWLRPGTSTPNLGSNTVITGHRFQYLPPNNTTFYNLDKLVEGDLVEIEWGSKRYFYRVSESFVVNPDQIEIEAATEYSRLTLYTCHPLWTAEKRLVVIAKLVDVK